MAKRRITLDLDHSLLEALDSAASLTHQSRNQFLLGAIRGKLQEFEHKRVDAEFARMAQDAIYQRELLSIETVLAPASDATWSWIDAAESRGGTAS